MLLFIVHYTSLFLLTICVYRKRINCLCHKEAFKSFHMIRFQKLPFLILIIINTHIPLIFNNLSMFDFIKYIIMIRFS